MPQRLSFPGATAIGPDPGSPSIPKSLGESFQTGTLLDVIKALGLDDMLGIGHGSVQRVPPTTTAHIPLMPMRSPLDDPRYTHSVDELTGSLIPHESPTPAEEHFKTIGQFIDQYGADWLQHLKQFLMKQAGRGIPEVRNDQQSPEPDQASMVPAGGKNIRDLLGEIFTTPNAEGVPRRLRLTAYDPGKNSATYSGMKGEPVTSTIDEFNQLYRSGQLAREVPPSQGLSLEQLAARLGRVLKQ